MLARFRRFTIRLSIRTRLYILLFLLALLPFFAYKFIIDLHRILLNNQAIIQQQTVINLSYILENRTDLWSEQILSGMPTNHLKHLKLDQSAIWFVNEYGQANYIVGKLPRGDFIPDGFFSSLGALFVVNFSKVIPFSLPYPYPQNNQPEVALVRQALNGETYQQYRMDKNGNPISIMSSTPLRIKNRIIGAIILEESIGSLLTDSLQSFYRIIGISTLIFLIVLIGAILFTASLSNRIIRLDKDVENTFSFFGKFNLGNFPDRRTRTYRDEISDLRHHIYQMLSQIGGYERYLKQLPKTLRHEIHNPLNRLSTALDLLDEDISHQQIKHSKHAVDQLKKIITSLSEADSIEGSLSQSEKSNFPINDMLRFYLSSVQELNRDLNLVIDNQLPENQEILVLGDGFMIEQMLDKIISNAKDFTKPSSAIKVTYGLEHNNMLSIKVRNEGKLLPEGYEKQIFDGMTSIRQVNSDDQPHLGLGLYIVKLITDFHGGSVSAYNWRDNDSAMSQGVELKIQLPISEADA